MSDFRKDEFSDQLAQLIHEFPEFSDILRLLIEELQKRTEEEILIRLKILSRYPDWP